MRAESVLILLGILIVFAGCSVALHRKGLDSKRVKSEAFFIDDKQVDQEHFISALRELKEIEHTWFCRETAEGGETGYNVKDKNDVIYEYRDKVDQKGRISTIRRRVLNAK